MQEALLCEGGNDSCVMLVMVALFVDVEYYETKREEDPRYRNNRHDFNCEGGNDSFVTVAVFMFYPFQFQNFSIKNPIVSLK